MQIVNTRQLSQVSGLAESTIRCHIQRGLHRGKLRRTRNLFELGEARDWFARKGYDTSRKPWRVLDIFGNRKPKRGAS